MVPSFLRQSLAGVRVLLVLTVVVGLLYPLAVYGVGRLVPYQADGSMLTVDGQVVGSTLIGQQFSGDEWFLPRPSAAGDGYDTLASGASNLGPENPDLLATVEDRIAEVAAREGVDPSRVPADAVHAHVLPPRSSAPRHPGDARPERPLPRPAKLLSAGKPAGGRRAASAR